MFNHDYHAVGGTNRWTRLTRIALTPAAGLLMLAGCHDHYDDHTPRVVEHRIEERPVYVPRPATPPDPHSYRSEPPPVDVETTPPAAQPPAGNSSYAAPPAVTSTVTEEVRYEPPPAEVYTTYEADLNPYGRWVDVEQYGRCWVPNDRPSGWAPYTVGHWDYSDYGWTWVAEGNEVDWGVVTYHYGRWFPHARYGWCWAPGAVWGPGWVGWREGNGYCGWCPLPPAIGDGFVVTPAIVDRHCPANRFIFCEERFLGALCLHEHIVRNNVTIVNKTTNITNITFRDRKAINRGVDVSRVEKVAGRKIEKVSIAEAKDPREARQMLKQGKPVVYDPPQVQRAAQVVEERARSHEQDRRPGAAQPAAHRTGAQEDARTAEQRAAQERANQQRETQQRNAREQVTHPQQQTPADIERARQETQARTAQERANQERANQERAAQERAAQERAAKERAAQAERERRNPTPPREREAEPAGHRVPAEPSRATPPQQPPTPQPREEPRVQPPREAPRELPKAPSAARPPTATPPTPPAAPPAAREPTSPPQERPTPQPAPHTPAPAERHEGPAHDDGGREEHR